MSGEDPTEALTKAIESARNVKFGRGVVGKTGHAVIALLALWVVIAFRLGGEWAVNLTLLVVGVVGTAVTVWWIRAIQSFAERNPAQAMLEGTEFLEYRRLEVQVKGGGVDASTVRVEDTGRLLLGRNSGGQ